MGSHVAALQLGGAPMSDTLPHYFQRLTLSIEDARKIADETHVICGIVDGKVRIKPKDPKDEG